jgi:hypothetical protein
MAWGWIGDPAPVFRAGKVRSGRWMCHRTGRGRDRAGTGARQGRDRGGTGEGQGRDRGGTGGGQGRDRGGTGKGQGRDRGGTGEGQGRDRGGTGGGQGRDRGHPAARPVFCPRRGQKMSIGAMHCAAESTKPLSHNKTVGTGQLAHPLPCRSIENSTVLALSPSMVGLGVRDPLPLGDRALTCRHPQGRHESFRTSPRPRPGLFFPPRPACLPHPAFPATGILGATRRNLKVGNGILRHGRGMGRDPGLARSLPAPQA